MKMSITRVDPNSIEIPKKPPHKSASEHRRATKPIMEKRRRARINNCLEQIKSLVLSARNKDPAKHTKLEKADILEMTVEYLKDVTQISTVDKSSAMKSLRSGFDECASEVERFSEMDLAMKRRLVNHLKNNFPLLPTNLTSVTNTSPTTNNNNMVSSTTSSPILSRLNVKSEPGSPHFPDSQQGLRVSLSTPPPSASSESPLHSAHSNDSTHKVFTFSPRHLASNASTNLTASHYVNHPSNYTLHLNPLMAPISPLTPLDDLSEMDCIPVDCSKSSKLNLDDNVWRPW